MMIPKPTRLTKIVRKMMRSGRVTVKATFYTITGTMRLRIADCGMRIGLRIVDCGMRTGLRIGLRIAEYRLRYVLCAAVVAAAATIAAAQQRVPEPTRMAAPPAETLRPEILGTHGIVAAGRHYSVAAVVRMLQQ